MDVRRLAFAATVCAFAMPGCVTTGANPAASARAVAYDGPLPNAWFVVPAETGELPLIQFHFAPPLDAYGGEVRTAAGNLRFRENLSLQRARGGFVVAVHDIDTGDDELTADVQNAVEMLDAGSFPKIRYTIESVGADVERLPFARRTPVAFRGKFHLKGVTIPLTVMATIEPTLDEDEEPVLRLRGSFALENLRRRFNIAGPGDPEDETGDRLLVDFNITLVPPERLPK